MNLSIRKLSRSRQHGVVLLFAFCLHTNIGDADDVLVTNFRVVADGQTLCTQGIQRAIDKCSSTGGGLVAFPPGRYLSGSLVLKDGVTLSLDAGSVLLGSTNLDDYKVHTPKVRSYTDNYVERSLIYAEGISRVGIVGRGVLDGQGGAAPFRRKPMKQRPYLIRMVGCQDVLIRDVTLKNAAMWMQHYLQCSSVLIDGITVDNFVNGNNDGLDIDSCEKVRIANCNIESWDDAICLKSTTEKPCQYVTITNCALRSHCYAFKCGTESTGGFKDIVFSNSTIRDTRLSGIALETVDGGDLQRVICSNVTMVNVGSPLFIRLGNRGRSHLAKIVGADYRKWKQESTPEVGSLREIVISNIVATGISQYGCPISGIPGHPVQNIQLSNLDFTFTGGGSSELAGREVPENVAGYPDLEMFGVPPAYGLYIRHATDVSLQNVRLRTAEADGRPAMSFDDVDGIELLNVGTEAATKRMTKSNVNNVRDRDGDSHK